MQHETLICIIEEESLISLPLKTPPMTRHRSFRPVLSARAPFLQDVIDTSCPHTYGVRTCRALPSPPSPADLRPACTSDRVPITGKAVSPSFLIPNWTFTFSAKEKDSETGLSYFGSRYYSSDLCIWLSVDPMSGFVQREMANNICF